MKAADELLKDAKSKLSDVLSSETVNKSSLSVANMMLETVTTKYEEAMSKPDKIREKQKNIEATTLKLLDEVLPSEESNKGPKGVKMKRKSMSGDETRGEKVKKQ